MSGGLSTALFVALWVTVLVRLPTLGRGPQQRALWATVLALALVKTASSPAGAEFLATVTDRWWAVPHLLGMVSAYFLLRFVSLVTGWVAAHPRAAGSQLAVTVTLIAAAFWLSGTATGDSTSDTGYWVVLNGYLGIVLALAGAIFWQATRTAPRSALRAGLRAMAVGVWIIALYAVVKTGLVLLHALGAPVSFDPIEPAANTLRTLGMILAVVGAAVPAGGKLRNVTRAYRSLWELRPLWTRMRRTFPDVILFSPRRALIELAGVEEVRLRLYRRVIEIRDGMLALRAYLPEDTHREAGRFLGPDPDPALVEACAVALALDRRDRGVSPSEMDSGWTDVGGELADEVAWLGAVSQAGRKPEVRSFTAASSAA